MARDQDRVTNRDIRDCFRKAQREAAVKGKRQHQEQEQAPTAAVKTRPDGSRKTRGPGKIKAAAATAPAPPSQRLEAFGFTTTKQKGST